MTYKEKKEYLEGYTASILRVTALQSELEEWHTIATSITQKITPVIVNTNEVNSRVEKCAIKIAEIQEKILDEIANAEYNRVIIQATINSLPDSRRKEILTMKFIGDMSVRAIAKKIGKDTDNVYKMIRTGIKALKIQEDNNEGGVVDAEKV